MFNWCDWRLFFKPKKVILGVFVVGMNKFFSFDAFYCLLFFEFCGLNDWSVSYLFNMFNASSSSSVLVPGEFYTGLSTSGSS